MLKLTTIVIFLTVCLASCSPEERISVFSEPAKTKYQLLSEGYKPTRFKDPDGTETILEDRLEKRLNDTIVSYSFQNRALTDRTIIIEKKGNNLTEISDHFISNGFQQVSRLDSGAKWAFYDPSGKYYYDVSLTKGHIICFHLFK